MVLHPNSIDMTVWQSLVQLLMINLMSLWGITTLWGITKVEQIRGYICGTPARVTYDGVSNRGVVDAATYLMYLERIAVLEVCIGVDIDL